MNLSMKEIADQDSAAETADRNRELRYDDATRPTQ